MTKPTQSSSQIVHHVLDVKGWPTSPPAEQRKLLMLEIRREHPGALAALILRTLVLDGWLAKGAVSVSTVSRL